MFDPINITEKLHTDLNKKAQSVRKRLRRRIPGRLTISNSSRGVLFLQDYRVGEKRVTKGIGKNMDLVYRLANQVYNEELLKRVLNNEKIMAGALNKLKSLDSGDILKALPPNYNLLDSRWIVSPESRKQTAIINPVSDGSVQPVLARTQVDSELIPYWASMPYCANNSFPQQKKHIADGGFAVRSKSEVGIFGLYKKKIYPFHYDELLKFGEYFRSPDFIVMRPDGSLFIHEHLGRMDLEEYKDKFYEKLMIYRMHGFELGKNLLLTFDDEYGNINLQLISLLIDDMYNR